ncbi:MAG: PAS domain S-box protein [Candidatus Hydrogenedentales bacterium]|jgi:PAS domain S-box-containing protein
MTRLLVVDDEDQNRCLLQTLLTAYGYEVTAATDGGEAIDLARANPPDLIITDILMPGMDGFTLCREWKKDEQLQQIPFVFYTATYTDPKDEDFALSLGAERFLVKPQEPDVLVAIVKEITDDHRANRLGAAANTLEEEAVYFKKYNARLIRKLEDKLVQLETTNRALCEESARRQETEMELRKSEERFRTLVSNIPGIVFRCHVQPPWRVEFVTDAALQLSGYSAEDFMQGELQGLADIILPEDFAEVARAVSEGVASHQPHAMEFRIRTAKGDVRWVAEQGRAVFDKDGNALWLDGVIWDVTLRREAQDKLRRSEERFKALFEQSGDYMLVLDTDSGDVPVIVDANEAACHIHGYTRGELVGMPISKIECDFDLHANEVRNRQVMAGEVSHFETTHRRKDGTTFPVEVTAKLVRLSGRPPVIFSVERDITEWRLSAAERERLISAIEQAAEMVVIADTEGTIQYVNPAFEQITGYSREEVIGQNPRILQSGKHDSEFYQQMWDRLTAGQTWAGHLVNRKKDGTLYEEEATISPVRDASGGIVNYVAVKRDVTREVELETQLRQAQKMEAIGHLAGGVAHDFNNVLQAMLGHTEFAMEEAAPDSTLYDDLTQVKKGAEHAASLTRQLLAFSRQQVLQPRDVDLNELLGGLLKMVRRLIGEDIQLEFVRGAGLATVHADPGQLEQVVLNLCVNARDAMPRGGKLTIETGQVTLTESYCEAHLWAKPGPWALLTVSDAGTGMDAETQQRLFEPFFTTKEAGKGTGLGLATVYGIVKQHGGLIHVYSEVGSGTVFKVYLPTVERPAHEVGQLEKRPVIGGSETILVAEDNREIRALAARILEKAGYTVLLAADGKEAVEVFRNRAREISLVLLDVIMPKEGGRSSCNEIKEVKPDIHVLFSSGYGGSDVYDRFSLNHGEHFIQKPYEPKRLLQKVREILDSPPSH